LTTTNVWRSISFGFSVGVITQLVVNVVTVLAIAVFGKQIYSAWLIRNILPRRGIEWGLVALAFIPSVLMEELLFRSLLIGTFQTLVPLPVLIIVASLIFGFMHQPQGALGMIVAGAINILFSVIFVWTGEVLVTFAAHYTVNMLQIVVASIVIRRFPHWWEEG
jgi:membrane protease YdiL (CAAX protease family)